MDLSLTLIIRLRLHNSDDGFFCGGGGLRCSDQMLSPINPPEKNSLSMFAQNISDGVDLETIQLFRLKQQINASVIKKM